MKKQIKTTVFLVIISFTSYCQSEEIHSHEPTPVKVLNEKRVWNLDRFPARSSKQVDWITLNEQIIKDDFGVASDSSNILLGTLILSNLVYTDVQIRSSLTRYFKAENDLDVELETIYFYKDNKFLGFQNQMKFKAGITYQIVEESTLDETAIKSLEASKYCFLSYTNPSLTELELVFTQIDIEVQLVNQIGAIVLTDKCRELYTKIDISRLPAGLYFLQYKNPTTNQSCSKQIVKI